MTRAATPWLLCIVALLWGCKPTEAATCDGQDDSGPVPSCEQVCAHLFDMTCQVGTSTAECVTICEGSGAISFPRVMRCYQAATSCDDVNGCSRGCGPDATVVPFQPVLTNHDGGDDLDGG